MAVERPGHSADGANDEAFETHIAPARDALAALLDASDHLRDELGSLPAAESQAMAEVAAAGQFKGSPAWGDPVHAAHNLGQALLISAGDCAKALVGVLSQEARPVYAHVVLARALLEHAGKAWWLLDPAIDIRLRVARLMNERIFGLLEKNRLPQTNEKRALTTERVNELFAEAERLGFQTVRADGRNYLEEIRPGQTKLIEKLFSADGDTSLGAFVYGEFSAVAHGTTWGLMSRVQPDPPDGPRTPGVRWGAVSANSGEVITVLTAVILATRKAYQRRNELFGWASQSWSDTAVRAIEAAKRSLPPAKTA